MSERESVWRLLAIRARRTALLLSTALNRTGGVRALARRLVQIYTQQGLGGIGSTVRLWLGGASPLHRMHYGRWRAAHDTLSRETLEAIRQRIAEMDAPPRISLLMPVYNPDTAFLRAALDSVLAQVYPYWELCIADDASPSEEVRGMLKDYAARDVRIRLELRPINGHICAASNSALALATSQWVALVDHDDLLPEHALFCLADAIRANPDAQLIYSDEDKIDERGLHASPYFKPRWNWELMRAQNYFSHLGAYRTELIRTVGGFRQGFEGAQDHDLVLRCAELVDTTRQIVHIPRVLYHWRVHAASTADSLGAKPYAQEAGVRAISEHLVRQGIPGHVEATPVGYRVHYDVPQPPPLVSILIPTRNAVKLVRQCIESIEAKTTYPNYEILLIDNGSDDPESLAYFRGLDASHEHVRVLRDNRPFNYAALNNDAVTRARGELVALVNNDIEVIAPGWLDEMVGIALQKGVGAVGARLWYPDKTLQHGGVILGLGGVAGHAHKYLSEVGKGYFMRGVVTQSFSAVTAACLVVRKSIFQEVGGMDAQNLKVAYNDVDFCLRVREAGYRNVWTPHAELFHHESATRGFDEAPEKRARFEAEMRYMKERWGEQLRDDPAYSPNLTVDYEDFSYAWPPRVPSLV